jgi:dTDP-4-amino-4,6-dideoxygalactose transaminase
MIPLIQSPELVRNSNFRVADLFSAPTAVEKRFEGWFGGSACSVSSGTAALELAMMALGVGSGDSVICPSLTFVACANAIKRVGAKPIFVDSCSSYWTIDLVLIEGILKKMRDEGRTPKAILAVHIYGQACDVSALRSLAKEYDVSLVEDVANALGATLAGKTVGSFGSLAVFSFNRNKIVTGFGGGLVASSDQDLIEKVRFLGNNARDPDEFDYVHSQVGTNYRMPEPCAVMILDQLARLDSLVAQKRRLFERYCGLFKDHPMVQPMPELPGSHHSRWLSSFVLNATDLQFNSRKVVKYLRNFRIEARPVWRPLHTQPLFRESERYGGRVAEHLSSHGLLLPSSQDLESSQQEMVVEKVIEALALS